MKFIDIYLFSGTCLAPPTPRIASVLILCPIRQCALIGYHLSPYPYPLHTTYTHGHTFSSTKKMTYQILPISSSPISIYWLRVSFSNFIGFMHIDIYPLDIISQLMHSTLNAQILLPRIFQTPSFFSLNTLGSTIWAKSDHIWHEQGFDQLLQQL